MTLRDDLQITTGTSASSLRDDLATGINERCNKVVVQNAPANTEDIFVGNADSQSIRLEPRDTYVAEVSDLNNLHYRADSGTPTMNVHIYQ